MKQTPKIGTTLVMVVLGLTLALGLARHSLGHVETSPDKKATPEKMPQTPETVAPREFKKPPVTPVEGLNLDARLDVSPESPAACGTQPTMSVVVTGVPEVPPPVGPLITKVQFTAYRVRTVDPPRRVGGSGSSVSKSWIWQPRSAGFFNLQAHIQVVSRQALNHPLAEMIRAIDTYVVNPGLMLKVAPDSGMVGSQPTITATLMCPIPKAPASYAFSLAGAGSSSPVAGQPASPSSSWTVTLPETAGTYTFRVEAIHGAAPNDLRVQHSLEYSVTQ